MHVGNMAAIFFMKPFSFMIIIGNKYGLSVKLQDKNIFSNFILNVYSAIN